MLKLSFDGSDQRLEAKLRAKGPTIVQAVVRKMDELMLRLQAKIVGEKLQGQVLKHRTGKLAGSIRAIPAVIEANFQGDTVVGAVEGGGGPAFYGRIHEYGGTFSVPEFQRRIGLGAKKDIQGRIVGTVRAHSATFPERSFMRTSLEEMREDIFASLTQTVKEELNK